eukprot:scaffold542485_cov33-Prasinocladus_malaysianus.AAC.1
MIMQPARIINSLINSEGSERNNGFGWASTAEEVVKGADLSGKNFVITGANSGFPADHIFAAIVPY